MNGLEINIPIPDFENPLSWAMVKKTRVDWLRVVCPRMGLETSKVILGEGLGDIYGDDSNAMGNFFIPEFIDNVKKRLEIVMDLRIATPELPEYIRTRLTTVKNYVLSLDWSTKEGHDTVKRYYKINAANYVKHQIAINKTYQEAFRYSTQAAEILAVPYQNFLYGRIRTDSS